MITSYYHDPAIDTTLTAPNQLDIRLKLPKEATHVQITLWNKAKRAEATTKQLDMYRWAESEDYAYYRFIWTSMEPRVRYLQYTFKYNMEGRDQWLTANGLADQEEHTVKFEVPNGGDRDSIHSPSWIRDRVWYQIFPERFNNGNSTNDPADVEPWGTAPTRDNAMGGDLQGIIQKLDYLKELGINALYLNPIFKAKSNHKYDTLDYFTIDPHFGTIEDLKQLTRECHQLGIKVVLDLVINHCGYDHPIFQDIVQNGENSQYRDWFYIREFPVTLSNYKYDSVWYFEWMPKLKTSNPQVKQYIFDIVSFWQSETGIDGWRIDVADEVEVSFLRELNSHVKKINANSFIISEIWHDAKTLMMTGGTDSVMNYDLRSILFDYVIDRSINIKQFHARLVRFIHRYSSAELNQMFNLLGSHDTERIMTRCKERTDILNLLVAFQYMMPGNPVIYYGDELRLVGENDPGCRACMPWDRDYANEFFWKDMQQWNSLKTTESALQEGSIEIQYCATEELYLVKRRLNTQTFNLIVNFSNTEKSVGEAMTSLNIQNMQSSPITFSATNKDVIVSNQFILFKQNLS